MKDIAIYVAIATWFGVIAIAYGVTGVTYTVFALIVAFLIGGLIWVLRLLRADAKASR